MPLNREQLAMFYPIFLDYYIDKKEGVKRRGDRSFDEFSPLTPVKKVTSR